MLTCSNPWQRIRDSRKTALQQGNTPNTHFQERLKNLMCFQGDPSHAGMLQPLAKDTGLAQNCPAYSKHALPTKPQELEVRWRAPAPGKVRTQDSHKTALQQGSKHVQVRKQTAIAKCPLDLSHAELPLLRSLREVAGRQLGEAERRGVPWIEEGQSRTFQYMHQTKVWGVAPN